MSTTHPARALAKWLALVLVLTQGAIRAVMAQTPTLDGHARASVPAAAASALTAPPPLTIQQRADSATITGRVTSEAGVPIAKLTEPVNGTPLAAQRVFVGRDASKAAAVSLSDRMGKTRLRMLVDSLGVVRIEFLDDSGRVVQRIPDGAR